MSSLSPIGMNNVSDPSKLAPGYFPLLINMDADDVTDYGNLKQAGVYLRPLDPYTGIPAMPMACFSFGRDYWAEGNNIRFGPTIEGKSTRDYGGILTEFDSPLTMLVDMIDGMYAGTQDEVLFIGGGDPLKNNMPMRQVHPHGVTPGTCCKVDNVDAGIAAPGYSVVFLSHNGICIGMNGGVVQNVTTSIVAIPKCLSGSATMRTIRNMTHYVVKLGGQVSVPDQFIPITPN